ncbi:Cytochrome P450 monooxygenase FCK2 [Psilocybe cubensis]|uniref:High nitrogen upregulated cytochrome P450 monooxygenase 2 n=2 Tax=Psilocybe cubensis TaxID=181762 RepID=A0A8H7Y0K7_PSICU|nr:Cytochrome P450 monooxygenase FCK2 [Psilocybe cubensis]KAH9481467.1 Cytochrome P450 monooxygenase FCK2 [Psilocybe cubensis]
MAPLSYTDTLLAIVGASVAVHLTYKKFESYEPIVAFGLLVLVPSALSALYLPHAVSLAWAALTVFPLFWTSLLTSILIYRLSPWHPLAQYPGPLLCKVSKFYLAFRSLNGKQYIYYDQLHEKYGNVVRIGPNELSICDANAIQPLLGNTGLPKGQFWDGRIPESEVVKPLIAIRDKTEHTRRRRPWTRAFSTNALKGYEELVVKRSTQLVDSLAAEKGVTNLAKWISFFTYDIMSDLAFGGGSEMMAQGDVTGLWHLLEGGQKNAVFMSHVPWLGRLFFRYPKFAAELKAFRAHARSRAVVRKNEGSAYKDIFHHLMDEDGVASERPTAVEVTSDGGLAIIAGSDTTSSAMTHLFFFLMCNPTAYKRLQAEVDQLGNDVLDTTKHAHMPYLNAAINEAMRLLPPILGGSQRTPDKGSGGRMLGSYFLAEGNSAFIPTYSLHRDPRNFSPATDAFYPERWFSEEKRINLEPKVFGNPSEFIHNSAAFIPFSLGPTNCAGKNLAYMEMRMVICMIMQQLDLRFQDGYDPSNWQVDMLDYFVTLKGVLPVIVTPRKGSRY